MSILYMDIYQNTSLCQEGLVDILHPKFIIQISTTFLLSQAWIISVALNPKKWTSNCFQLDLWPELQTLLHLLKDHPSKTVTSNPFRHLQKAQSSPNFNPFQTKIELQTLQNFKPTNWLWSNTKQPAYYNNKFFVSIKFSCQSIFTTANMSNINAHFSNTK